MTPEKTNSEDSALIDKLGGTGDVAKMFDIKAPSVSSWRKKGIPKPRMMYLKAVYPAMFAADVSVG
ncbi:hypothetical protein AAKU55_004930 [Oxalobacteraceae bacterium GrIS 1.11]